MIYKIQSDTLSEIADSIRAKNGETEEILLSDFAGKIGEISAEKPEETVSVDLDFSNEDMTVLPSSGAVLSKVEIPQPETLIPGNIAEGVNIAGIIGTLATSGGGVKITSGTIVGTGEAYTLNHGLGVMPDVIVVYTVITSAGYLRNVVGFSSKMLTLTGFSSGQFYVSGYTPNSGSKTTYLECTYETMALHEANEETVIIGGSSSGVGYLYPDKEYYWIAIGGLT